MTALASLGPSVQHGMPLNTEDSKFFCASGTFSCQNSYVDNANSKSADNGSGNGNTKLDEDGCKVERKQPSGEDQTAMTIEFLRARLLSERAASKAAREEVKQNAKRVLELQNQLQLEIEQRRKAEAAVEEVVAKLRLKGLPTTLFLNSVANAGQEQNKGCNEDIKDSLSGSESEKLCQEETLSKLMQEDVESSTVSLQCEETGDTSTFQTISSNDGSTLLQSQNTIGDKGISSDEKLIKKGHEQSEEGQPCERNVDDLSRSVEAVVHSTKSIESLGQEVESNQVQATTKVSAVRMLSQTSNPARERREVIEEQLRGVWNQVEEEIAAVPEGQSQRKLVQLKLEGLVDHVASLLEDKLQESENNHKLVRSNSLHSYGSSLQEGVRGKSETNEVRSSVMSENPYESENSTVEEVCETKFEFNSSFKADSLLDRASPQMEEMNKSDDGTAISTSPVMVVAPLSTAEIFQGPCPSKMWKADTRLREINHFLDGVDIHPARETINSGFGVTPSLSDENLLIRDSRPLIRAVPPGYQVQNATCFTTEIKMRGHSDLPNSEMGQIQIYRTRSDHALIAGGRLVGNTSMGHTGADWLHSPTEQVIEKQYNGNGPLFPKGHGQYLIEDLASHISEGAGSNRSSHGHESMLGGLAVKREIDASEGDEEYGAIPGREKYMLTGTTTTPCKITEFATKPNDQNDPEGNYQFSSKVNGNPRSQFYQAALSKNSPSAQPSKVLHDDRNGRLGDILAALHLAKQQIRNSRDEEAFQTRFGGVCEDGFGGGTYYVSSPTRMESPLGYPAVEGQQVSHVDHKLSPYAADWSSQALIMQSPTSATALIERHNMLRRSKSTSEPFAMPSFENYRRPRRKVHLGNGISLYTTD